MFEGNRNLHAPNAQVISLPGISAWPLRVHRRTKKTLLTFPDVLRLPFTAEKVECCSKEMKALGATTRGDREIVSEKTAPQREPLELRPSNWVLGQVAGIRGGPQRRSQSGGQFVLELVYYGLKKRPLNPDSPEKKTCVRGSGPKT